MATIERDGATIGYEVTGDGPPLVLGHSLLCDRRMWQGVAPRLAERYRVINIDFRGHGASTAPREFTFDDLVADWLAVMDAETIDRAALCGLSMGGMTAMRLAVRAPSRVGPLILIDSNPYRENTFNKIKYTVLSRIYGAVGLNEFLVGRVGPIMFARTTIEQRPELVQLFASRAREYDRKQLTRAIKTVTSRGPFERLDEIDVPALVLVGEQDAATPPYCSEAIAVGIPDARLVRITDAGHLAALEQPQLVTDEILSFLEAHTWA